MIISILDPEAMYIVKNVGTMVIGFPENLIQKAKVVAGSGSDNVSLEDVSNISDEEAKASEAAGSHKF